MRVFPVAPYFMWAEMRFLFIGIQEKIVRCISWNMSTHKILSFARARSEWASTSDVRVFLSDLKWDHSRFTTIFWKAILRFHSGLPAWISEFITHGVSKSASSLA